MRKILLILFLILLSVTLGCPSKNRLPQEKALELLPAKYKKILTQKIPFEVQLLSKESDKDFYAVNFEQGRFAYLASEGKIIKVNNYSPSQIANFDNSSLGTIASTRNGNQHTIYLIKKGQALLSKSFSFSSEKVALIKVIGNKIVVIFSPPQISKDSKSDVIFLNNKGEVQNRFLLPGQLVALSRLKDTGHFVFTTQRFGKNEEPDVVNTYVLDGRQTREINSGKIIEEWGDNTFYYNQSGNIEMKKAKKTLWKKKLKSITKINFYQGKVLIHSVIGLQGGQDQKIQSTFYLLSTKDGRTLWERNFIRDNFYEGRFSPDNNEILITAIRTAAPAYLFNISSSVKAQKLPDAISGIFLNNNLLILGKSNEITFLKI